MNKELDRRVYSRIKKGKRNFSIPFFGITPTLTQEWLGVMDGVTKNGITCNLNFNHDRTEFDTGKPSNGRFWPPWSYYDLVNNGVVKTYPWQGNEYMPTTMRVKTITSKKIVYSGKFLRQHGDNWVPV